MNTIDTQSTDLLYTFYYSNLELQSIYTFLELDGFLDEIKLIEALDKISIKLLPMLFFRLNEFKNRWEDIGLTAKDCVHVITPEQAKHWRANNFFRSAQCCIQIVRGPKHDFVRIQNAHIICDGMGTHQFLKYLSGFYNGTYDLDTPMDNMRSFWTLYKDLDIKGVKKAKMGVLGRDKIELSNFKRNINPGYCLKREVIEPPQWEKLREQVKKDGCSVNDLMVVAWMRTLHLMSNNKVIKMNCPGDIRAYGKKIPEITMANFTGSFSVRTEYTGKESFKEMMQQARKYIDAQKEDKVNLFTVRNMGLAALLPKNLAKYIYQKSFVYSDTAYTNVGLIKEDEVSFNGVKTVNAFITGTYYSIPMVNFSFTTYKNRANLVINSVTNEQNFEVIKQLGKNIRDQIDLYMQESLEGTILPLDAQPTIKY